MKLSEIGDPSLEVVRDGVFASLGFVWYETGELLVFLESERYLPELQANPHVSGVLTTRALAERIPGKTGVAVAANPRLTFYTLHNRLAETAFYWTPFANQISSSARIHPRAYVAEKNVRIGERSVIEPNATVMEHAILGNDVIIRAGAVIGSEGFQFAKVDGRLLPVKHAGGVRIEDGAEVQSNTCVDLAVFGGFTVIGEETKVDNLVRVGHNVRLGKRNRVAANAMLGGSMISGDDVWFGPSCVVSDGLKVGDGATITLGAVVTQDVPAGMRVTGNFAIEHQKFIAHMKAIR
jgi:UDP-3-O-[3-hydroxymyristoyl] glucosamine N-acyltransferase